MKILSKYEIKTGSRLGIFIAGYRWSGSGAVSDWLAGHDGLCRVEGSEAAFGEIRALNYGLRYLLQTAAGHIRYGERLGRWALCPDPELWDDILGSPLTRERGKLSVLYTLADALYFTAASYHIIPRVTKYKQLLDAQLGMDFRSDKEYLDIIHNLTTSLQNYMSHKNKKRTSTGPEDNDSIRLSASMLLSLFYQRLSRNGKVLIFDNAISGINPEHFKLLDPYMFPGQIIIFVRRDPRDQFAELVKYSGSTFSFSVGKFIRQYRHTQAKTRQYIDEVNGQNQNNIRFIRQVSFEDFVLNTGNLRTRLKDDLQEFWKPFGIKEIKNWSKGSPNVEVSDGMNNLFNPGKSMVNIGIWRSSGLHRQMNRISNELSEFIL